MDDHSYPLDELNEKLNALLRKQAEFQQEIESLRQAIGRLQAAAPAEMPYPSVKTSQQEDTAASAEEKPAELLPPPIPSAFRRGPRPEAPPADVAAPRGGFNLERFIGENLINKIGILIVVIGVGIGVKYAIDHELISPLTRIILGYLAGIVLLVFAFRLRERYANFSAVLLSGSMAVLYFITFAAHSFYDLIPQLPAFILMVLFTAFTVFAATRYDRQVIALIGLVGAYGVPFLLGEDPEGEPVLYTYMALINAGVLVIAVQRYWKPLYYAAFLLTWLIFGTWYAFDYQMEIDFGVGMIFNAVFFTIFYLTFLAYKLLKQARFAIDDILALLLNAFLFYGLGYAMLNEHPAGKDLLGGFTLVNALIHFVVAMVIYRNKLADRNLFYLVSGLVLVFLTAAVPVQLDGDWVTLIWMGEAALLFWIGRTKGATLYEQLFYPMALLAVGSLFDDWIRFYGQMPYAVLAEHPFTPFFHIHFLTSLAGVSAFSWITYLHFRYREDFSLPQEVLTRSVVDFLLPAVLLVILFGTFWLETGHYWHQAYALSGVEVSVPGDTYTYEQFDNDLMRFKNIWQLNFAMFFLAALSLANIRLWKNQLLALFNLVFNFFAVGAFLLVGLYELSGLRESYLDQSLVEYYPRGTFHLWVRYISYSFVALLLWSSLRYIRQMPVLSNLQLILNVAFYLTILWIASSELIHWLDFSGAREANKLALSILWGVYAFVLVGLGIWKQQRYLRIGAIALFAITLLKLFFYDLAHLDTISKTIVFVSLGSLLLIISFLYNKYRHAIFNEEDE